MLTVFFYARLWRRSGVMTDVEFAEIRYAGKPAAFLRGFRALYLGVPINCIILGWVNLAMVKILMLILGRGQVRGAGDRARDDRAHLVHLHAGRAVGRAGHGPVPVRHQDAMVIVLAVAAVAAVGGIDAMKTQAGRPATRRAAWPPARGSVLSFVPDLNSAWMPMITFLVYISLNWWATWYPGAEPGGGGYVAQRMFCAKDEKHSLLATLWFNIAHYAIRPWPWILVGLASLILYPTIPPSWRTRKPATSG